MINEFLRRCPYCQITNRLRLPIKAHRFTCASCNPFEVFHPDHIGPLTKDAHGNEYILAIIDAFSRWVELFPTKSTTAVRSCSIILVDFALDTGITTVGSAFVECTAGTIDNATADEGCSNAVADDKGAAEDAAAGGCWMVAGEG